jgi:hypothetical protein
VAQVSGKVLVSVVVSQVCCSVAAVAAQTGALVVAVVAIAVFAQAVLFAAVRLVVV